MMKSLAEAREELELLFYDGSDNTSNNETQEDEQEAAPTWEELKHQKDCYQHALNLLEMHPTLASETFSWETILRLSPLQFLLMSEHACLKDIQEVVAYLPKAVSYIDTVNRVEYFPLYQALKKGDDPKIAEFLASKIENSEAIAEFLITDSFFSAVPPRLSIRATKIPEKVLLVLIETCPELLKVRGGSGFFKSVSLLEYAIQSGYSSETIQNIQKQSTEKIAQTLRLHYASCLNNDQLETVRHYIFPNLCKLSWYTDEWKGCQFLMNCLNGNTSIHHLEIIVRGISRQNAEEVKTYKKEFPNMLITLLEQNPIQTLYVEVGASFDEKAVIKSLLRNQCLQSLTIRTGPNKDSPSKETLQCLLQLLKTKNTTLTCLPVMFDRSLLGTVVYKRIEYYLRLNRCGRNRARDPSMTLGDFIDLLTSNRIQQDANYGNSVQYGLLREVPGLWSQSSVNS